MRLSDDSNRFLQPMTLPLRPPQDVLRSPPPIRINSDRHNCGGNCSTPYNSYNKPIPIHRQSANAMHYIGEPSSSTTHVQVPSNAPMITVINGNDNRYAIEPPNRESLFPRNGVRGLSPALSTIRPLRPRSLPITVLQFQRIDLPSYQCRQSKMMRILHEFETLPALLVSGYIREITMDICHVSVPRDLVQLCLQFVQYSEMAQLIDSKSNDALYKLAWEKTENEDYLFAEQLIAYLLRIGARPRSTDSVHKPDGQLSLCSNSEDASTNNLMAVIKYFTKDYAASERYFQRAAAIDPSCDIIMNNYAVLLLEQERFSDAEEQIIRAIRCNPRCIKNHQQFAYILFTMGKFEEAAKECQLMIFLEPNIESYSGYAWLLEQMGRFEESCAQYRQLISLEPDNAAWYFWYAVLLQRCDKYLLSRDHFAHCIRMDPDHEGANGNYAYSLYLNHEFETASEYIELALQRDGQHLCVHYYYALLCVQRNEVQTAVNELYTCLEMLSAGSSGRDGCCPSLCKNEKGCLMIHEEDICALLRQLGF